MAAVNQLLDDPETGMEDRVRLQVLHGRLQQVHGALIAVIGNSILVFV